MTDIENKTHNQKIILLEALEVTAHQLDRAIQYANDDFGAENFEEVHPWVAEAEAKLMEALATIDKAKGQTP